MERGYLIAALALITTFTAMSHGARSLVEATRACHHSIFMNLGTNQFSFPMRARTMRSKVSDRLPTVEALDVQVPDESALVAELNIPQIQQQARMAQQIALQQQAMAQRLTEEMSVRSEEMSRNAQEMSRNMTEHLVRQNVEIARCARARALQQVERTLKQLPSVGCE
jgi:hypothetical protein